QAARSTNINSLATLSVAFAALPGKREQSQVGTLVLRLVCNSHHGLISKERIGSFERLFSQCSSQILVEALKQPGCVGTTRTVVLNCLGNRYRRSFNHVWEFVDYCKQEALDLDLDSPPRVQMRTARPGN